MPVGVLGILVIALWLGQASDAAAVNTGEPDYFDTITVHPPPLPRGAVERSRKVTADRWRGLYCARWTDDCLTCSLLDTGEIRCRKYPNRQCKVGPVRCLEVTSFAPLFCSAVNEECGGIVWGISQGQVLSITPGRCPIEHKREKPEDWSCTTHAQSIRRCRTEPRTDRKECIAAARKLADHFQNYYRELLRASQSIRLMHE